MAAFRAMGVEIDQQSDNRGRHSRSRAHGLQAPPAALDLGNSGTAMRLIAGLLAGQGVFHVLTGDESLSSRPMQRIIGPLADDGRENCQRERVRPPLRIAAGRTSRQSTTRLPVASAQVKSAMLLAGLYARGETTYPLIEPAVTRDHTERMLRTMGVW